MTITQLSNFQDDEAVNLPYLAGLGIKQHQEIAYIHLNKQVFKSHIESLYVNSAANLQKYRKLLATDDCVSIIVDLSILIERPEYDASSSEDAKHLERALAQMVHENVLEVGDVHPAIEFRQLVSEHRGDHRAVVAGLLCDFMADILALVDAGLLPEVSAAATGPPPEPVLTAPSPAPAEVRPAISLGEYSRRKKDVGGGKSGKDVKKVADHAVEQASGLDPRPQKRMNLAEEKGSGEVGISRWAGQAAF